jgi:hypothetical protein
MGLEQKLLVAGVEDIVRGMMMQHGQRGASSA